MEYSRLLSMKPDEDLMTELMNQFIFSMIEFEDVYHYHHNHQLHHQNGIIIQEKCNAIA